jgi:peptidoglycan/xylan/chitin deacetylase (PgdA/CDA1 family)
VLLYHRVSPVADPAYQPISPDDFEAHCHFISSNFRVIPLSELLGRAREGMSLAGYCAITFDDGYRDFLVHAWPVLSRFQFPTTHFLLAETVRSGTAVWTYRARRIVTCGHHRAKLPMPDLEAMGRADRERWLDAKELELGDLPELPAMLRPSDLERFDPKLVEWGSHTVSHSMLDRVSLEEARAEIDDSKRALESVVGRPIRYLAYPNGRSSGAVQRLAGEAGYEAAFAVGQGEVCSGTPMFAVPRVDVGDIPLPMLSLEVSGVTEGVRRLRRLLAVS